MTPSETPPSSHEGFQKKKIMMLGAFAAGFLFLVVLCVGLGIGLRQTTTSSSTSSIVNRFGQGKDGLYFSERNALTNINL